MNLKKAKLLRKIAQFKTIGLPEKLYHFPKRKTHDDMTVELSSNCTRYWYKAFKRGYKKNHNKDRQDFLDTISSTI